MQQHQQQDHLPLSDERTPSQATPLPQNAPPNRPCLICKQRAWQWDEEQGHDICLSKAPEHAEREALIQQGAWYIFISNPPAVPATWQDEALLLPVDDALLH